MTTRDREIVGESVQLGNNSRAHPTRRTRTYNYKKPPVMSSREFADTFDQLTKSALIDALWCASQLGTDDSEEEITTQAARNALAALESRGDRIPATIKALADKAIGSDGVP